MDAPLSLARFEFHRMSSTPRPYVEPNDVEREDLADSRIAAKLFAALTAAHAGLAQGAGGTFALGWDRLPGARTVRVLLGGDPYAPVADRGSSGTGSHPADGESAEVSLLYPPGSRGRPIAVASLLADWESFPVWLRCAGRPDPLWAPENGSGATVPGRGGFEDYVAHIGGGFAWLVLARPLPPESVDAEMGQLNRDLPRLRRNENSEPDRIDLLRGEARYRELARARTAGLWSVSILVGGADTASAHQAARLLCSSSDLDELPYALRPLGRTYTLDGALRATATNDDYNSPFAATSELLAAIARPPRRELAGIRVTEPAIFDLTPERDGDIHLGSILDDADLPVGEFTVALDTLNRHTFVAGATGAGKSQTVRHLLEGLHHKGIPWLVIEPAKAEYARMAGRIDGAVAIVRPGDPDAVPVGINPLEPEEGFPLQTHIDLVRALFLAAFEAMEPFPQVLARALHKCYTDLGWNTVVGTSRFADVTPRYPRLGELRSVALEVVESIGYSREITDNVRGFIDVRIGSLDQGTPGTFFDGRYPLDMGDLLAHNVVLEIEDVGNDEDKAFFIGVVLIRIYEYLRVHARDRGAGLRHVTVVEEAHRLLSRAEPGTPAAHAVELFAGLLAEIRAYGEGIVVAEQIPVKIAPEVVKNTALKIMHRLPALEDREFVGATMNLDEAQSRHVVSLPPGRASVFADRMDRPVRVHIPVGEGRENTERAHGRLRVRGDERGRLLTLRELEAARQLASTPRFILWIEVLTIAHLVGRESPSPEPEWLSEVADLEPPEVVEEAIAYRVAVAVDSRYAGLAQHYQPEELAGHLRESAVGAYRGATACDGSEWTWQAGRFRWADIYRELAASTAVPGEAPHPATADWERRGIRLPGANPGEQLERLALHPDLWLPKREVVLGPGAPPAYVRALAAVTNHPSLAGRIEEGLGFLGITDGWPGEILTAPIESRRSEAVDE